MRVFSDMDLCEQLGSGMKKILKSYPESIFEISEHFISTKFAFSEEALKVLGEQTIDDTNGTLRDTNGTISGTLNGTAKQIYELIKKQNDITIDEMIEISHKARRTVARAISELKDKGFIERVGSKKVGFWKVLKG